MSLNARLFRRYFFLAHPSIMSGGIEALQLKEEDVTKLLAAGVHLGSSNVDYQMESYVFKRKPDGKKNLCKGLMFLFYAHNQSG